MDDQLLNAALLLAERGWRVFPCLPRQKTPAWKDWQRLATADRDRAQAVWGRRPYNLGVVTGDVVVVDLDVAKSGKQDGRTSWEQLLIRHRLGRPETYTVRTPSGGSHLYFTAPEGVTIRNSAGKLGEGIDVRGHGGYIVGAGSTTAAGSYSVVRDIAPMQLPTELTELLTTRRLTQRSVVVLNHDLSRYATACLRNAVERITGAVEGTRNQTLNAEAWKLGRLAGAGVMDPDDAIEIVVEAAMRTGLPESECRITAASGMNAGMMKPSHLQIVPGLA